MYKLRIGDVEVKYSGLRKSVKVKGSKGVVVYVTRIVYFVDQLIDVMTYSLNKNEP